LEMHMASPWKAVGRYAPLIIFVAIFVALSVLYVPNNTRVDYEHPCSSAVQLSRILPFTCGKVVFRYVQNKVVAEVSGVTIDVAVATDGSLVPVNNDLYVMYVYCCEAKYPPAKHIDLASLAENIAISILASAIPSIAVHYILRRVMR